MADTWWHEARDETSNRVFRLSENGKTFSPCSLIGCKVCLRLICIMEFQLLYIVTTKLNFTTLGLATNKMSYDEMQTLFSNSSALK